MKLLSRIVLALFNFSPKVEAEVTDAILPYYARISGEDAPLLRVAGHQAGLKELRFDGEGVTLIFKDVPYPELAPAIPFITLLKHARSLPEAPARPGFLLSIDWSIDDLGRALRLIPAVQPIKDCPND